jgi:Txe/YoeB family toxin of Txe-Axe toxin-antitoxin module
MPTENEKTLKKIDDLINNIKMDFFYFIDNDEERQKPYQWCEDLRKLIKENIKG